MEGTEGRKGREGEGMDGREGGRISMVTEGSQHRK